MFNCDTELSIHSPSHTHTHTHHHTHTSYYFNSHQTQPCRYTFWVIIHHSLPLTYSVPPSLLTLLPFPPPIHPSFPPSLSSFFCRYNKSFYTSPAHQQHNDNETLTPNDREDNHLQTSHTCHHTCEPFVFIYLPDEDLFPSLEKERKEVGKRVCV